MYNLKLTRQQELAFIEIGIRTVMERVMGDVPSKPTTVAPKAARRKTTRRWTPAQRAKFQGTMKKLWARRRQEKGVA